MSTLQTSLKEYQNITPPSSLIDTPLTPPSTDEKAFIQAHRVITLFKDIKAGRHVGQHSWTCFRLAPGEYDEIERQIRQDESLFGFAKDKIRYDYDGRSHQLVVRMPTGVHEVFIKGVEDAIRSQLKAIRDGSNEAAFFAQKVHSMRSTEIHFPVEEAPLSTESKHEPDASFWHDDARYPGVIIEVAYSQKKKSLDRLAEDYLLDSDASVQVVVGLDIEYGQKGSRKATLSVWRTKVFHTVNEDELRVVREMTDEAFRDDEGNPTDHPGLRLQMSDFACEELTQDVVRNGNEEIVLSTQHLCRYLATAEDNTRGQRALLVRHSILPGVKKRKRSETPPEMMASDDEAKYVEQEQRAAKRMESDDADYENIYR
ncbi:hypothetical protein MMC17_009873 [Xylographa soralifera]|nr:hypothetical protein [Xylographa soralifera]